jgi:hypothetical protein
LQFDLKKMRYLITPEQIRTAQIAIIAIEARGKKNPVTNSL